LHNEERHGQSELIGDHCQTPLGLCQEAIAAYSVSGEPPQVPHWEHEAGDRDRFNVLTIAAMRGDRDARCHCDAVSYDDRVTRSPVRPVVLRNGAGIEDPLGVVIGFLQAPGRFDVSDPSRPASFGEPDLRLGNRGGARISAAQIAAILQRRRPIERALLAIPPGATLSAAVTSVPWLPLRQLFDAFAGIRGVGLSKMTKALYPKRPALIPMLDSVVQAYLRDDDLGAQAPFAKRALGLVRGYQRDLDRNRAAVQAVRQELARRGYRLTEVRILDLLIWSARAAA